MFLFYKKRIVKKYNRHIENNRKGIKDNTNSKVEFKVKTRSNKMYKVQRIHQNNKSVSVVKPQPK